MNGIYIAAIITTTLSLLIIGSLILQRSLRKDWSLLISAALLEMPMSFLAFYAIRTPLDGWLQGLLGKGSEAYRFLITFYAPITEEPIKLWILLIPYFLKRIDSKNAVYTALAIGLGFGIGEMWLIATRLAENQQIALLPWYSLMGYVTERFIVCIMHGAFTVVALRQIQKGFIWGALGAMTLHFIGNFPLYLSAIDFGGLGKSAWQIILKIWIMFYFLCMVGVLVSYRLENLRLLLFGKAQCPECGAVYSRPLHGINMFTKRYERCPVCKKYHWIKM